MFNSITVRNVHGGQWMMSICHHFAEFWFFNLAERLITSDNPFCDKPFKFVLIPGSLGNEKMKIPKVFFKKWLTAATSVCFWNAWWIFCDAASRLVNYSFAFTGSSIFFPDTISSSSAVACWSPLRSLRTENNLNINGKLCLRWLMRAEIIFVNILIF